MRRSASGSLLNSFRKSSFRCLYVGLSMLYQLCIFLLLRMKFRLPRLWVLGVPGPPPFSEELSDPFSTMVPGSGSGGGRLEGKSCSRFRRDGELLGVLRPEWGVVLSSSCWPVDLAHCGLRLWIKEVLVTTLSPAPKTVPRSELPTNTGGYTSDLCAGESGSGRGTPAGPVPRLALGFPSPRATPCT